MAFRVLKEEELTKETLIQAVSHVYENHETYINAMNQSKLANPIETIMALIEENKRS